MAEMLEAREYEEIEKEKLKEKEGKKVEEKRLTVQSAIVMPAIGVEEAVKAFEAYQELASKITTPDDVQDIGGKAFKKKSFWRKVERFFNLSLEKKEERREQINGVFTYHFTYRAIAPNGAFMDGCGSCSSNEKGLLKTEHNTRAIAETRAKNRAISDLCAFGEVSAEEIDGEAYHATPQQTVTIDGDLLTQKIGFGKHKDKTWGGVELSYLGWLSHQMDDNGKLSGNGKKAKHVMEMRKGESAPTAKPVAKPADEKKILPAQVNAIRKLAKQADDKWGVPEVILTLEQQMYMTPIEELPEKEARIIIQELQSEAGMRRFLGIDQGDGLVGG